MLTTQYTPGSPIWVDLASPDVDASAAFYSEVFEWEFESQGRRPETTACSGSTGS